MKVGILGFGNVAAATAQRISPDELEQIQSLIEQAKAAQTSGKSNKDGSVTKPSKGGRR